MAAITFNEWETKHNAKKHIVNAILNASGFQLIGKDDFYDDINVNFDHTRIEMIKAVYKNDFELVNQTDPEAFKDCAKVLGCFVYF